MSCDEVRELLPDYALGAVTETEGLGVRRHLRGCGTCRAEAEKLDEGLALFAAAAHEADPPPQLEDRVLGVLKAEWSEPEAPSARAGAGRRLTARSLLALAAAVVVVAGSLAWGVANQVRANNFAGDAMELRDLLDTLGGKAVRVGRLNPGPDSLMEGSFLIYDGDGRGDSWVLVLVRAPGYTGPANVDLLSRAGGRAIPLHPMEIEEDGDGWTGLFSQPDLTRFDAVRVTSPAGELLASGRAIPRH